MNHAGSSKFSPILLLFASDSDVLKTFVFGNAVDGRHPVSRHVAFQCKPPHPPTLCRFSGCATGSVCGTWVRTRF